MAGTSPDRVGNLLAALALAVHDDAILATERVTGLPGSGTPALMALCQFLDGCNVARLADVLGLSHSGAVRLVEQLEAAGHVRRSHLVDRRQINVTLTARGRRTAQAAAAARLHVVDDAVRGLTEAQRRQLDALLSRLIDQLAARRVRGRVQDGRAGAWWCRECDFAACGRDEGRCPVANAAAAAAADLDSG